MHPARPLVEALVDKELSPSHRPIGVQALFTDHMDLAPEKEGSMGIDQKQGIPRSGQCPGNGYPIGSLGFGHLLFNFHFKEFSFWELHPTFIEFLDAPDRYPFNITANGALTEIHGHPGLKSFQ